VIDELTRIRRLGSQTLCWVYTCPNSPTTTMLIRSSCNWPGKRTVPVKVCEPCRHKYGLRPEWVKKNG
jgi:hypothetical protein